MQFTGIAVAALFGGSFDQISPADAQTFGSSYTSTAPKDCRVTSAGTEVDDSTIRTCQGKAGLVVLISEDDLRETVSVGRNRATAAKEPAARVWFGPFNSTEHTVEWRTMNGKPFAIIQRWHIADNADQDKNGRPIAKPMLAVTRLPPGVCHVAYVDYGPGGRPPVDRSIASSNMSAEVPSGNRSRMPESRPSSSSMVKPCTSDQARAMAAP